MPKLEYPFVPWGGPKQNAELGHFKIPKSGVGRDYEDTLFFNPYNGEYMSIWQYGVNKSLGDWIIWLQIPLHFGTHWGFAVKCLWAGVGLALPLLAVTGLLMYWNRFLSKRWRNLKTADMSAA